MSAITFTREQLYDRVWSTPVATLAQEFGLSDVGVTKTCRRLQIPTPPRGYWAKLAAGKKPKRKPLPKLPVVVRQQDLAAITAKQLHNPGSVAADQAPPQKLSRVELPVSNRSLHPVARELQTALLAEQPEEEGMLHIRQRVDIPSAKVSKKSVDSLARSIHVILLELESRGIEFRKFRGKHGHPAFHCGRNQLSLSIEETVETVTREPTAREKRRPSSEWQLASRQPSGRFCFSLGTEGYYQRNTVGRVLQQEGVSLEEIAAQVVEKIWDTFVSREKAQLEAEDKWQKERTEQKVREEQERKAEHQEALESIASLRAENLIRAAQWWRLSNTTAEFIDDCERRWRSAADVLTLEQDRWLTWARGYVKAVSPVDVGYPDLAKDGPFDPAAVPFGGPYPDTRALPLPPTLPEPAAGVEPDEQQHYHGYSQPKPYPYWLKHQR